MIAGLGLVGIGCFAFFDLSIYVYLCTCTYIVHFPTLIVILSCPVDIIFFSFLE